MYFSHCFSRLGGFFYGLIDWSTMYNNMEIACVCLFYNALIITLRPNNLKSWEGGR